MYKTFLNDIFSNDDDDIKLRLENSPRTNNYNKIAASNTPDYAAGLGGIGSFFDNISNANQTRLDFAKDNYNMSNRKAFLDAILAHERGLQSDKFAHEKTTQENRYNYLNGKRAAEHKHLLDMLVEKNKGDLATTKAQYEHNVMEQDRLQKEFEYKKEKELKELENATILEYLKRGYVKDKDGNYVKNSPIGKGFINIPKTTPIPQSYKNTPITTNTTQIVGEDGSDNKTMPNSLASVAMDIAQKEAQQEKEEQKTLGLDIALEKSNPDAYYTGKLPGIHPNSAQHYEQTEAQNKGYDDIRQQGMNNLKNLSDFMKNNNVNQVNGGWSGLSADVLRFVRKFGINTDDYMPLINDNHELFFYNKKDGTIYSVDDEKGLIAESSPEEAGFLTETKEVLSQPVNSLGNAGASLEYPVIKLWMDNNMPEKAKNAWETAYNWSDNMDKAGANLIDKVVNWLKKR